MTFIWHSCHTCTGVLYVVICLFWQIVCLLPSRNYIFTVEPFPNYVLEFQPTIRQRHQGMYFCKAVLCNQMSEKVFIDVKGNTIKNIILLKWQLFRYLEPLHLQKCCCLHCLAVSVCACWQSHPTQVSCKQSTNIWEQKIIACCFTNIPNWSVWPSWVLLHAPPQHHPTQLKCLATSMCDLRLLGSPSPSM